MGLTVAQKLIRPHLVAGDLTPDGEIALAIDQTLTQDATGTLAMLALEAMEIDRVETELSAQYVDHNLIQEDGRNADDHLFLRSACRRYGVWYSGPGNGVSHPVHMQRFGRPGATLLGSDSHTCAAGSLGMLAIGAGGLDVAMAMAGEPYHLRMPRVWGVRLVGELPDWVSAKDIILELLRRHDVDGGKGTIIEYYGPALTTLSAMDRHVIANMGTELGATTSVFPSDDRTEEFLVAEGRGDVWSRIVADDDAEYDLHDEIDLSRLEPLIARPSSPGNVVSVREVEGEDIYQAYIGSSANPGYRDFAVAALMVKGRHVRDGVSFDINPTSRQLLHLLIRDGHLASLVAAGARLHQAGCNGCIGMGQAPATGRNSLRTVPRNFPGRSGTREDAVFLCSPETATASALTGKITDPRNLDMPYPRVGTPANPPTLDDLLAPPLPDEEARRQPLVKSENIVSLPRFDALPEEFRIPVLLKVGDNVSTDEILPAGARVLPFRSNIPRISDFVFRELDEAYVDRVNEQSGDAGHAIVGGRNYGQGSSREHAAVAPRYLGLRAVLAKGFARIHRQNLINYGVLPLIFSAPSDFDRIEQGEVIRVDQLQRDVRDRDEVSAALEHAKETIKLQHALSPREREILLAGGLTNWMRDRRRAA